MMLGKTSHTFRFCHFQITMTNQIEYLVLIVLMEQNLRGGAALYMLHLDKSLLPFTTKFEPIGLPDIIIQVSIRSDPI